MPKHLEKLAEKLISEHVPAARSQSHTQSRGKVERAMSEVHRNIPSTVKRANVSGKRKESMLRAIALSKARKAGARIPKRS